MHPNKRLIRIAAPALVAVAAGACSSPLEDVSRLPADAVDGLVLDDRAGLAGTFRAQGRTIRFETAAGNPRPEPYATDPALSPYEVDARFIDAAGRAFAELVSGHTFIEPSWGSTNDDELAPAELRDRERDRELARMAAERLAEVDLPETAAGRRAALVALGRSLETPSRGDVSAASATPASPSATTRSVAQAVITPTYDHEIEIWSGRIAFTAYLYGRHSGVRVRSFQGIRVVSDTLFGNHGRRPGESGMSRDCARTFVGRRNATPAARRALRAELNNHVCSTPYSATSGAVGGRGHNCNDDATVEATMTALDATNVDTSACFDTALNSYPPTCPSPTYLSAR